MLLCQRPDWQSDRLNRYALGQLVQRPAALSVQLYNFSALNNNHRKRFAIARPSIDINNRTVLVVDDIYDEGHTLAAICEYLKEAGAKNVYAAALKKGS